MIKKRDYDSIDRQATGGTGNQLAVDTKMQQVIRESGKDYEAYEEGFAAASGVRSETAETGGRIRHPESKDAARPRPSSPLIEKENAGLADTADE